jgi:hypothetical protein
MPLLPGDIDDFVTATISNFKRNKWTDISMSLQEYVTSNLITEKKVFEAGGPDIRFDVQVRNLGNATNSTGLYAQDQTNSGDVLVQGVVDWSAQKVSWAYDIFEDIFQTDRETIIRHLLIKEHVAMNDMAELDETNFWTAPTGTSDKRPKGLPYWIVKDATTTPDGDFNGGNPSGFSAGAAGIDSTTYPRWRNWTFGYDAPTTEDLVKKVKKALRFTKFMAPHPHATLGYGKVQREIYTTYRVLEPLERLCESRNDNLGNDVARFQNNVLIGGVPVKMSFYLEVNDTSDPLYGIDWSAFRPFVKRGAHMLRHPPEKAPNQHSVRRVFIDNFMNYICYDRRKLWVGSKS